SGAAAWLSGATGAGLLQLSGPGRARLTGSYLDHRATGRARAHGVPYRFAVPRVHQAGLHAAIVNRTAAACQPPAAPARNRRGGPVTAEAVEAAAGAMTTAAAATITAAATEPPAHTARLNHGGQAND